MRKLDSIACVLSAVCAGVACTADMSMDEPGAGQTGVGTWTSAAFRDVGPCDSEDAYEPGGLVQLAADGAFTPPCVRLAAGGTIVFRGGFDEHPLEPAPGGDEPSPITPTATAGSVEVELANVGFYPYRCAAHPDEGGAVWASAAF